MNLILETDRLQLRPWTLEDVNALERLVSAAEVADGMLMFSHPLPDGWGQSFVSRMIEQYASGEAAEFAVCLRATGELIGGIGLNIAARHKRAGLGYWFGFEYWGNGYATEAALVVLRYGFQALELHRIEAGHFPRNAASGRVLRKIGMRFEGTVRHEYLKGDVFEDTALYGRLATDGDLDEEQNSDSMR